MNPIAVGLYVLSAIALLGSPGPGIAALLAVGRRRGFSGGLRFFAGLQLGLAAAAGACASGLFSILADRPGLMQLLAVCAGVYLVWLAWAIATSPGEDSATTDDGMSTFGSGLVLGFSNPKAYLAFVTLFASRTLVSSSSRADASLKWALTIAVIVAVDLVWLRVGAQLRSRTLTTRTARGINLTLGAIVLMMALIALRDAWS